MRIGSSWAASLVVVSLVVAGCSSSHRAAAGSPSPVWLCQPGATPDPCVVSQIADVVSASGAHSTQPAPAPNAANFDCFYVYPTVSTESGTNADLRIQPAETSVAEQQASRFSSVCQVWAPMYRQVTLGELTTGGLAGSTAQNAAYESLLSSWRYYLQHDNHGRPIIFIGHSQGAAMLIRLISAQVDPNPSLRAQMVVALIVGGNVQVPIGRTVGGSFQHVPLCTSSAAAGCVIAYSSFDSPPPATALFGRPGQGVSLQSLQTTTAGQQVACVNPAALGGGGGGTADLSPYFFEAGTGRWLTYPGRYTGTCESAAGATWLQVTATKTAGDTRPVVHAYPDANWGLHNYDVNLSLGNLVSDVSALEGAYRA